MPNKPVRIILVEDDEVDNEMFVRTMQRNELKYEVRRATDGRAALDLLAKVREDGESAMVFLDLNMPGMNGHEFLEALRSDPVLTKTPVFVLTSSDHPRDIAMAFGKNVAGYFLKEDISSIMKMLTNYAESNLFPALE